MRAVTVAKGNTCSLGPITVVHSAHMALDGSLEDSDDIDDAGSADGYQLIFADELSAYTGVSVLSISLFALTVY